MRALHQIVRMGVVRMKASGRGEKLLANALIAMIIGDGHSAELVGGLILVGVKVEGEASNDFAIKNGREMLGGGGVVAGE